ncbi:MAG: hypothetical protein GC168_16660 [Candidatus Hydrogenedens sp.]|nr:hypothetical protein [Candidatus Hydrogenedens sp.]
MILLAALALISGALTLELATMVALGWRPEGVLEHGITGAILLGTVCVGASLMLPATQRCATKYQANGLLLLVSLALCGALLEWGANRANDELGLHRRFHTRGPFVRRVHEPGILNGITGPSHFTTDSRGIRAPEPPQPGDARWLAVGGSTTECVYLDDRKTWPWLVSEALDGVWVGNVGISGFDSRQHLRFVEDSPLLRSCAGIVVQPGVNDLWRYLADEETESVFRRFDGDRFTRSPRAELNDFAEPSGPAPWWTRSALLQLIHTLRQPRRPPLRYEEGRGGDEMLVRKSHREEAPLTDERPDLTRGLFEYGDRIRRLIQTARARGLDIVFTTQPTLWDSVPRLGVDSLCWFGWLPDGRYLSLGRLRYAMDAYNDRLREICAEEDAACVDLDPMNGNPEYFYDDCHFTEAGARAVADAVAQALRARLQSGGGAR